TGSEDSTARLWTAQPGKPIGPTLHHQGQIMALAFSPDGQTVLTGSVDNTARLWAVGTGKPIGPALQHQGRVLAVAFSPDGKAVLTGSDDNTARLWKVPLPMEGSAEQIIARLSVLTNMEMDEDGALHVLDAEAWHKGRRRLQELMQGEP